MRYATIEERKSGEASEPVYLDSNGTFLCEGENPITLEFDLGKGQQPIRVLNAGAREKRVIDLIAKQSTCH